MLNLKSIVLIFSLFLMQTASCSENSTQNKNDAEEPGWKLVWSDEFDSTAIDTNKWNFEIGTGSNGWGNNELQYYTDRLANASVLNGWLVIEAKKENYQGKEYTSARMTTRYKGDWINGRYEIRARLPFGPGTWPAIWMLPSDWEYGGWPNSGEIDIMEHVGRDPGRVHGTVHTGAYNHSIGTQKGGSTMVGDFSDQFHNYSIEWNQEKISFFVDSTHYFTFSNDSVDSSTWPFDKRFHMMLNLAIGGNWPGSPDGTTQFPQRLYIDYVRVYQWK
jgi:beta-glucanase (GH16 family)